MFKYEIIKHCDESGLQFKYFDCSMSSQHHNGFIFSLDKKYFNFYAFKFVCSIIKYCANFIDRRKHFNNAPSANILQHTIIEILKSRVVNCDLFIIYFYEQIIQIYITYT